MAIFTPQQPVRVSYHEAALRLLKRHYRYHKFALYLIAYHSIYINSSAFSYVYFHLSDDEINKMNKLCAKVTVA